MKAAMRNTGFLYLTFQYNFNFNAQDIHPSSPHTYCFDLKLTFDFYITSMGTVGLLSCTLSQKVQVTDFRTHLGLLGIHIFPGILELNVMGIIMVTMT